MRITSINPVEALAQTSRASTGGWHLSGDEVFTGINGRGKNLQISPESPRRLCFFFAFSTIYTRNVRNDNRDVKNFLEKHDQEVIYVLCRCPRRLLHVAAVSLLAFSKVLLVPCSSWPYWGQVLQVGYSSKQEHTSHTMDQR
jgi:hypothetical protein